MKDTELNNKILQNMDIYESIENLNPSYEWNQKLRKKLMSVKPYRSALVLPSKFTFSIFIITMIIIGIIMTATFNISENSISRDKALEIISQELLVNPNSFNK